MYLLTFGRPGYSPSNQSFDVFVDASFTGDWDPQNAEWDPDTARSRTGYVILYASCPVIWASKLQTEIALSTTEAEYLAILRQLAKCFHSWNWSRKCKGRDVDWKRQRHIFIVVSLKTTVAPSNWLPVSRTPRCAQELGISTQSIITFATRFEMEPFPFIQSQQLTCLLTYSPRFAMRRSTQGWGSSWCVGNLLRQALSSKWGSNRIWVVATDHWFTVLR